MEDTDMETMEPMCVEMNDLQESLDKLEICEKQESLEDLSAQIEESFQKHRKVERKRKRDPMRKIQKEKKKHEVKKNVLQWLLESCGQKITEQKTPKIP